MGIDTAFYQRIAEIGTEQGLFPGARVAILGDCRFLTDWATGDNRGDLARFADNLGLARVETLDVMGSPTIELDLHEPLPPTLEGRFDVVIDAGTTHCCFDVAAVLRNALALMRDRGTIFHLSALSGYFGRCYYNFNPLLFKDFYFQNGFTPLALEYRIPSAGMGFSRLRQKLMRGMGRRLAEFGPIPIDGLYLQDASAIAMRFGRDVTKKASVIPNDAIVLFAARRDNALPFTRPIPSFFSAFDRAKDQSCEG